MKNRIILAIIVTGLVWLLCEGALAQQKKDIPENINYIQVFETFGLSQNYIVVDYGQKLPITKNHNFKDAEGKRFKRAIQVLNYLSDDWKVIGVTIRTEAKTQSTIYLLQKI